MKINAIADRSRNVHSVGYLIIISFLLAIALLMTSTVIIVTENIIFSLVALCVTLTFIVMLVKSHYEVLLVLSLSSIIFLALYFPILGGVLDLFGNVELRILKIAVGIRSSVYSVGIVMFVLLSYISYRHKFIARSNRNIFFFTTFYLTASFFYSSEDLTLKATYLLNTFIPLFFSYLAILYLNFYKGIYLNKQPIIMWLAIMVCFCIVYFFALDHIYDVVRPDLVSAVKSKSGEPLNYGAYPGSWQSIIGEFRFQRFVGSFPDPIIFGYLLAVISIYLIAINKYLFSLVVLVLLAFSGSKGAWLFFINAIFLINVLRYIPQLRVTVVGILISIQFIAAFLFHSSAFIHLSGLLGALRSVTSGTIQELLFGFGIGAGGNLARISSTSQEHGWLSSGSESGIGILVYQLGIVGLSLYLALIFLIDKKLMAKFNESRDGKYLYPLSMLYSIFINSMLQENCVNSSVVSIIIFATLITVFSSKEKVVATYKMS